MPNLPTVSSNIPLDLRTFLDRTREALDGRGLDSLVTARQLVAAGIAQYNGNSLNMVGGPGVVGAPVKPQNVEAAGALANIMITWDKAAYRGHSYAEIWAAAQTPEQEASDANPTIGQADIIGMAPGTFFAHNVGNAATRWYWVRFVNLLGEVGPYNATEGTKGETSPDPAYLLELLTGEIRETQLYQDLQDRIDLVDGNGPGSVAYRIAQQAFADAAARQNAVDAERAASAAEAAALQAELDKLYAAEPYDATKTYTVNNLVTYGGYLYRAKGTTTGNLPTNTAYWESIGQFDSLVDASADSVSKIIELNDVSATSGSASARKLAALNSTVYNADGTTKLADANAFSILSTEVFGPDGSVSASRIDGLNSTVYKADGSNKLADADAFDKVETQVYPDGAANASSISTLRATVYQPDGTTERLAQSDAFEQVSAQVFPDGRNNASRVEALRSAMFDETGTVRVQANQLAEVRTEVYGPTATAVSRIDSLNAAIYNADGVVQTNAGFIDDVRVEIFGPSKSEASRIQGLRAQVFDTDGTTPRLVSEAGLTQYASTQTGPFSAIAKKTDILNAQVTNPDGTTNQVSLAQAMVAQAGVNGDVKGLYTVKVDANGHVAGFGLSSEILNGQPVSSFIVNVDNFAITGSDANGNNTQTMLPFVVRTSGTTINGENVPAGVYIKQAFIADGTITNAKIGDAAIDDAKIVNLNAGKISAGFIDAARIEAGSIDATKIDTRNLTIKDSAGNVIFGSGTPVDHTNVNGLGGLALLDEAEASDIVGLGALATQDTVNGATQVTNLGALAYQSNVTVAAADIADLSTYIAGASIDFAQINNSIYSSTYVSGSAGWRLFKDGSAELNDATFRGQLDVQSATSGSRLEIDGDQIRVYEGTTLRVVMGRL